MPRAGNEGARPWAEAEFWRGGSLGGSAGFGLLLGLAGDPPGWLSNRRCRTGGFGRLLVERPVVSALYGTGWGAALCSNSSAACSSLWYSFVPWISWEAKGAPSPLRSGVVVWGDAAPPLYARFFGGGPKASGSFNEVRGRDWCSRALVLCVSLPLPTSPAYTPRNSEYNTLCYAAAILNLTNHFIYALVFAPPAFFWFRVPTFLTNFLYFVHDDICNDVSGWGKLL